jgi:hypothetical protein
MADRFDNQPRWPALVAMLAAGCVYLALPEPLSVGPSWLLLAIVLVLLIPLTVTYRSGNHSVARVLTFVANGAITLALMAHHLNTAATLLRAASTLWFTNILVFALWYWKLDGGGPLQRERATDRSDSDFLFPQMLTAEGRDSSWSPHFIDYLFLAFNTSTAFSPTDTAVLSRWAKLVTMLQALISLMIVVLLASRAVNIL